MADYHYYNEINLKDSDKSIAELYNLGYKFTRKGVGIMQSTRLVRVDLENFKPSSENRRILRKFENLGVRLERLPYEKYDYIIGKWMKDFYFSKFGEKLFDVQTIKKIFLGELNFNSILIYEIQEEIVGFCLCYTNYLSYPLAESGLSERKILHYSYPFYKPEAINSSLGIAMMTKAIEFSKSEMIDYIYLGGYTTSKDNYKLQFRGIEWWNEEHKEWSSDIAQLKSTN